MNYELPETLSYSKCISKIYSQKNDPICVACAISEYIIWRLWNDYGISHSFTIEDIWITHRKFCGDDKTGVHIKTALDYLIEWPIEVNGKSVKIEEYSSVESCEELKKSLYKNGPCIASLPIYHYHKDKPFWKKLNKGFYGNHAVLIIGWNKEGFIVRNSWGKDFGDCGNIILPYSDFKDFIEVWTMRYFQQSE